MVNIFVPYAGSQAVLNDTIDNSNKSTGLQTLFHTTIEVWNNAVGYQALLNNVTGSFNTPIGDCAGTISKKAGPVHSFSPAYSPFGLPVYVARLHSPNGLGD